MWTKTSSSAAFSSLQVAVIAMSNEVLSFSSSPPFEGRERLDPRLLVNSTLLISTGSKANTDDTRLESYVAHVTIPLNLS